MTDITELLKPLNIIYYEYDKPSNMLILDQNYTSDASMELVSITYLLQQHHIPYIIDKQKHLHIVHSTSWINKLQHALSSRVKRMINKYYDIYILSDKEVDYAKNLPVIITEPLPSEIDFNLYDALIFTSKNAVLAIDSFNKAWKQKPVYALAPQTAKTVKMLKGQLRFVGKSHYGNTFAEELLKPLKGKRTLYLRAKNVASDLYDLLNAKGIVCDEQIVYETSCKPFDQKIVLPKNSIIIFSSPSTIDCFFKNADWDTTYTAIAIGHTTAQCFPQEITPYIAETTSIDACIRKAVSLQRKR